MRLTIRGTLVVGLAAAASGVAAAQQPLVVPIVGSPAAQQMPQPSPGQTYPSPSMPQPAPAPASPGTLAPAATAMAASPAGQFPAAPTAGASSGRKLQLSFDKGNVSLVAQNVTVREILTEWQRQNGCQFVNADKLSGVAVSFEFAQEKELRVIDSLLRGVAGYIVGPRADTAQSGSICGSVFILATSRPTASASNYTPGVASPMVAPIMQPGSPDDEIPPVAQPMNPQQIQSRPNQPPGGQPPGGQQPGGLQPPAPGGFGPVPVGSTTPAVGRFGGPPVPPPTNQPVPGIPGAAGRGGGSRVP